MVKNRLCECLRRIQILENDPRTQPLVGKLIVDECRRYMMTRGVIPLPDVFISVARQLGIWPEDEEDKKKD